MFFNKKGTQSNKKRDSAFNIRLLFCPIYFLLLPLHARSDTVLFTLFTLPFFLLFAIFSLSRHGIFFLEKYKLQVHKEKGVTNTSCHFYIHFVLFLCKMFSTKRTKIKKKSRDKRLIMLKKNIWKMVEGGMIEHIKNILAGNVICSMIIINNIILVTTLWLRIMFRLH